MTHGGWLSFTTCGGWSWFIFVSGQLSSFMGGQLHFLGSGGGGAVVGGHWRWWEIMRAVVVKSVVGGGDEHGWWWWEESDCQTNIVCLFGKESQIFKFTCEIITCMISHDDLRLVPWKSTRRSMEFIFFFQTLYGITRHNNKKTIPIIFCADSAGMSNSKISPAEFWDSSWIPGRIPGGE